jgi:hypothetical protein
VTCLAHALHRVAEKIRELFPNVDRLIAKTKAVFVKAPYRVHRFRELQPDIPLVPKPVLTRWGTWIDAAIYYWQHFQAIKAVLFFIFYIVSINFVLGCGHIRSK